MTFHRTHNWLANDNDYLGSRKQDKELWNERVPLTIEFVFKWNSGTMKYDREDVLRFHFNGVKRKGLNRWLVENVFNNVLHIGDWNSEVTTFYDFKTNYLRIYCNTLHFSFMERMDIGFILRHSITMTILQHLNDHQSLFIECKEYDKFVSFSSKSDFSGFSTMYVQERTTLETIIPHLMRHWYLIEYQRNVDYKPV